MLVKGPSVMVGYPGEPERTRQVTWKEWRCITGGMAQLDEDGFLAITDRVTRFSQFGGELIKSNPEMNESPRGEKPLIV